MSTTTKAEPTAIDVRFGGATLEVKLDDNRELIAPLDRFPRLKNGSPGARLNWRFANGGKAIHWPDLDVEIAVEELLTGLQLLQDRVLATSIGVCRDLVYEYRIPGPREIRSRAVFAAAAGRVYSLVYTAIPEVYDEYLPEFNAMLGSLEIPEGCLWAAFLLSFGMRRRLIF